MAEAGIARSMRGRIAAYAGDALTAALNGLTGAGFQVVLSDRREMEKAEEPLVWRQPFSLADGAVLWLIAGKDVWEAVGQMVLGGGAGAAASDEDCQSTWREIASQTMSGKAREVSAEFGYDVVAKDGDPSGEIPGSQTADAVLEFRNSVQIWHVRIAWTSELAQAFAGQARTSQQLPGSAGGSATHEPVTSKTLDLLLDVALPVSVSFGKTSLQIREVLKLNTGSVVELDRLVSEPVEVIVNNCVIARGEVVVVDGNYGVRVIHLASRADRLRSGMGEAQSRLGVSGR
jgi:flagellar motor switch protein FliN/FliY